MSTTLLTDREVDVIFRYPAGRTLRLIKAGKIRAVTLPDGEIRIPDTEIERLLSVPPSNAVVDQQEVSARG